MSESKISVLGGLNVGVIGAGNMGFALMNGLLKSNSLAPKALRYYDPKRNEDLEKQGVIAASSNQALYTWADVIVVAVKPNLVDKCLRLAHPQAEEVHKGNQDLSQSTNKIVVSLALGVSTIQLKRSLHWRRGCGIHVARVMPNTPCLVLAGMTVGYVCPHATTRSHGIVRSIFQSVGEYDEVKNEALLEAVTGLSGSGPAYVAVFIEALADGGVFEGLPRPLAVKLATQTVLGAAKLVASTPEGPARVKDNVSSPGGATIRAIYELEKGGMRAAVMSAVSASAARGRQTNGDVGKK